MKCGGTGARGWASAAVIVIVTSGCSGTEVSSSPGSSPASFEQLELEVSGGYGPPPCSNGKDSYQVQRAPARLMWAGCDWSKNPSEPISGDRALSAAELDSVTSALAQVAPSTAHTCVRDAAIVTLDVTTPSGAVELYADDSYSGCPFEIHAGRSFVTGLGPLSFLLAALAMP